MKLKHNKKRNVGIIYEQLAQAFSESLVDKNQKKAPNLAKLMTSEKVIKIFHYARFDIGVLHRILNFMTNNIY